MVIVFVGIRLNSFLKRKKGVLKGKQIPTVHPLCQNHMVKGRPKYQVGYLANPLEQ